MDLFGPYGLFLIWFGFLCIFFSLWGHVKIDFGSFIKKFLIFGFSLVFVRFFLGFFGVYKKLVIYIYNFLLFYPTV